MIFWPIKPEKNGEKFKKYDFCVLWSGLNCLKMDPKYLKKTVAIGIPDVTLSRKKKFDPSGLLYAGSSGQSGKPLMSHVNVPWDIDRGGKTRDFH